MNIYLYTHVGVCIYIYIYIHMYTYIYISYIYRCKMYQPHPILRGGGRILLTEILLPRIARQENYGLISMRGQIRKTRIESLSSMRVSNRIIPPSEHWQAILSGEQSPRSTLFWSADQSHKAKPKTRYSEAVINKLRSTNILSYNMIWYTMVSYSISLV